ncbi:MAG: TIGR02452 family protein [Holosporales bacterium]|nr:TIGR02452 family protein [Holosporales bacterium]
MKKRFIFPACVLFLQFNIGVSSEYPKQDVASQKEQGIDKESMDFIKDRFCYDKTNQLKEDMKDYPWQEALREILFLAVKLVLLSPQDFYKPILENTAPEAFSDEYKNLIAICYTLWKIINQNLLKDQALQATEEEIKAGKYPSSFDSEKVMHDVRIYLNANIEDVLKKLNKENLQNEFQRFYESIPDYRKPMEGNDPCSYGIWSTRANFKVGIYINQNGEAFPIPAVERAKTSWEIFDVTPGDITALTEESHKAIESITSRFEKTIVKQFNGSCQEAVIEYGIGRKVALVSFSNGEIIGGGSLFGKMGQEELNMHCIAGLYESLLPESAEDSDKVEKYSDVLHSPESVLYSQGVTLIKRVDKNYVFLTADEPISLDVINVAGINFNPKFGESQNNPFLKALNLKDPYEEIERRIELMFTLAIIHDADVLILGKYNLGNFMGDPRKISQIYNKYIKKYNGYFEKIVLAAGDLTPYAD